MGSHFAITVVRQTLLMVLGFLLALWSSIHTQSGQAALGPVSTLQMLQRGTRLGV